MNDETKKIIIEGVTESGETFRPSDWAERMSGQLSTLRKRRIQYSPLLQPSVKDGNKCVLLDRKLKASNPELYHSILEFAHNNHLKICGEENEPAVSDDKESS
ncbi:MAG: acetyltransferase [Gammaproteobacteria bacterium RIFCSPLOWO2_02_FULL_42_14]|nr:MAG: acetyltransferase [Gammaproteobacteria bacterium RIFCSPHIGHO2_02_FULL_42_43]OGT28886.1 MAG: acetyltransferase [Gammaproteobacteria bacterium RIFCSPHIGHO2_01_FULL_42_8]OGT51953.1 MAG: acetyltransferase [Gammaproteobacteria bacterium RIFCSPHIGHO2_12_FULL_41_25]OGT61058.1 MAG: acetyltransferase [Gammaproteobacteria bacterium RIFCSPLOWO2_02_FULL_42_14]OGT86985.1 MAG: acetyltransferase [Gammaproteobacteria bacterium RIFCSPLOWO2_12_FULL_42_18]